MIYYLILTSIYFLATINLQTDKRKKIENKNR